MHSEGRAFLVQFSVQIPNTVDVYIFYTLACGISPFLYVLGMSEFRAKIEELVDHIWEGIANIGRKLSCRISQIQPSGEDGPTLDKMNNRDEASQGTSTQGARGRTKEIAGKVSKTTIIYVESAATTA